MELRFHTTASKPDRGGFFRFGVAVVCLFLSILTATFSRAHSMEYLLKAGFLEKFARFTDWPEEIDPTRSDLPFTIAVIGKNPFEGSLETLYTAERIKNRPVKIRYISTPSEIDDSHILFIAGSEKDKLDAILKATHGKSILVIGDTTGFGERGCHINFYITPKGTVHFEINLAKVKESGLHMQLVLLEIAKIIY